jgi:8-oxo-dGTP pyrophosphatase MutT (NUDIX family)
MMGYICICINIIDPIFMQLKVFCNQSLIYVGGKATGEGVNRIPVKNKVGILNTINTCLSKGERSDIWIQGYDTDKLVNDFMGYFSYVEAAGGLVYHLDRGYLFIRRYGIPDLPKGKLKISEVPWEGAIREVMEETGVVDLKIIEELPSTYHIYERKGKMYLKKTFWFAMESGFDGVLIPQTEEEITRVEWLPSQKARKAFSESYRSLSDTLTTFICD